jgi:hypothetical protein
MTATLPFTLTFNLIPQVSEIVRPALQSYSWLVHPSGSWLMVGGRRAGLHQFKPGGDNFPAPNRSVWRCDPTTGSVVELFDLSRIDPAIGDPLMATDQQFCYDADTGEWLIVGGYGHDVVLDKYRTFDMLLRIPVVPFAATIMSEQTTAQKAAALEKMINVQRDPFFAVTGGALRKLGSRYLLAFGQWMQEAYNPFVSSVDQRYINAVRFFRFDEQRRAIAMGELSSADLDQPFHRRDGTVVESIDPATGQPRIVGFGGAFPPGKLDGYMNPVYVTEQDNQLVAVTDRSVTQLFNQYACPVIVVWDPSQQTVYHTFFGGISRSWYWQTPDQNSVYEKVTAEGRNDGLPFVADITTLVQTPVSGAAEYISPEPVPHNSLAGASTDFIPVPTVSNPAVSPEGVVNLGQLSPGQTMIIGYIYGGVVADYPLPVIPNYGTHASNALYQVGLTHSPSSGYIPSSEGHLANGVLSPAQRTGRRSREPAGVRAG